MKVSTSILNADFNNLEKEIKKVSTSDFLHLDVMDGHFVPNISFGAPVLKNLQKVTNIPLDTHLMIQDPLNYIEDFVKIGSKYITIHIEANEPFKTVERIKELGIGAGISLKPDTKLEEIYPLLDKVDLVLVMTVEPGFGGQSFLEAQMKKVLELAKLREKHDYGYVIQVDGGINDKTISKIKGTGVDIVVAGSFIMNNKDPKKAIEILR